MAVLDPWIVPWSDQAGGSSASLDGICLHVKSFDTSSPCTLDGPHQVLFEGCHVLDINKAYAKIYWHARVRLEQDTENWDD
jgi:hypothetical protein